MTLANVVCVLSILASVLSFAMVHAKEKDHKRWKYILYTASLSLFVSGGYAIAQHTTETKRQEATKRWESEQRANHQKLLSDIRSLNESAASAFARLEVMAKSIPQATVLKLTEEARQVQIQLSDIAQARERAPLMELQSLIANTQTRVGKLVSAVRLEETKRNSIESTQRYEGIPESAASQPVQKASVDFGAESASPLQLPVRDASRASPLPIDSAANSSRLMFPVSVPPVVLPPTESKPEITITVIPPSGDGSPGRLEDIRGTVKGVDFRTHKVVIYSFAGNVWWVQPDTLLPLTAISSEGSWETEAHLGRQYAALLVIAAFKANVILRKLPEVGQGLLAIEIVAGIAHSGK